MRNFASLTDKNYLPKFLAMVESLSRHSSEEFTLHVLAMDRETHFLIYELLLPNVNIIPLDDFEHALNLSGIKANRTWQEYCWTAASNLMEYLLPWMDADGITYLDADLFFFSDPKMIFSEIGERSIGITPHRFPAHRKHMEKNGKFNVGLVHAKNNATGVKCTQAWAKNCRDWCFNRIEGEHACGDQKYLDYWPTDFPGEVCEIENIGVNLAPWNIEKYCISEGPKADGWPVVFYHLHEYLDPQRLTNYALRDEDREFIYKPYVAAWTAAKERIAEVQERLDEARKQNELQAQRA